MGGRQKAGSREPKSVLPSMLVKLGTELYGNIERGTGAWQRPFSDLLGMTSHQLRRILNGESAISKTRVRQYWELRAFVARSQECIERPETTTKKRKKLRRRTSAR